MKRNICKYKVGQQNLYVWLDSNSTCGHHMLKYKSEKKKKNYDFMCKLWSAFIRVLRQNYMT